MNLIITDLYEYNSRPVKTGVGVEYAPVKISSYTE